MDHDAVDVIETGIVLSSGGEHNDISIKNASLLPTVIEGARPVHAVMHDQKTIQFFDRDGSARVYCEAALVQGDTGHRVVGTAAPHHGIVVPVGDYFVVSEPNLDVDTPEDELPPRLGATILDGDANQIGDVAACTVLHGEAQSASLVAFGCVEGVLLTRSDGKGAPTLELLKYDDNMPEGRVGTLSQRKMRGLQRAEQCEALLCLLKAWRRSQPMPSTAPVGATLSPSAFDRWLRTNMNCGRAGSHPKIPVSLEAHSTL